MGLQTLEAGEKELNRLRKLKLERMGDLMLASREKIRGTVHTMVAVFVALRPVGMRGHVVVYCQQRNKCFCLYPGGGGSSIWGDRCVCDAPRDHAPMRLWLFLEYHTFVPRSHNSEVRHTPIPDTSSYDGLAPL